MNLTLLEILPFIKSQVRGKREVKVSEGSDYKYGPERVKWGWRTETRKGLNLRKYWGWGRSIRGPGVQLPFL